MSECGHWAPEGGWRLQTAADQGTAWVCAVCGRAWVTGYGDGLHTAPECEHGAEVRLPVALDDQADALRWIAAETARRLEAGSPPAQRHRRR